MEDGQFTPSAVDRRNIMDGLECLRNFYRFCVRKASEHKDDELNKVIAQSHLESVNETINNLGGHAGGSGSNN